MQGRNKTAAAAAFLAVMCLQTAPLPCAASLVGRAAGQDQSAAVPARVMGTVTAISGQSLTVQPSQGAAVTVSVAGTARILRMEPGEKTLSAATPVPLNEISVGDRVLASGTASANGSINARLIVTMKKADIAARQQAEEEAWRLNGVGGIVKSVDASTGSIVLSEATRSITVKTTPSTVIRRYASNSVAFRDAKPATLAEIQPGDQLRAKGDQPPVNGVLNANAVVFGDFQNIAGIVTAVNATSGTLTVKDLATRKAITLTVNSSSQLHKLSPQVARLVAMRMRALKAKQKTSNQPVHPGAYGQPGGRAAGGFSRVLQHAAAIPLSDLHKGDAVLIVATHGAGTAPGTAITLLAGVEPMLRASAKTSSSMFSSSWSLGGSPAAAGGGTGESGGGGESTPQQR